MEIQLYTVTEADSGICIKEYLLRHGFSVTLIKAVKYGGISLNGVPVNVRATVLAGDRVEITFPPEGSENIPPIDIPLNVVYEDESFVVVDKPTNMPTHPSKGNHLPTLANAVMAKYGEGFVFRAITRLDRDTSGLVLIAKDRLSAYALTEEMKAGRILKRYIARLTGIPKEREGVIDAPIRRVCEGDIKRGVFPDGKKAVTEYRIIDEDDESSVAEITLHTGRTHQIRVHFAHIGHPLLGDFLYGERRPEGYFLRCNELKFSHPKTKEIVHIKI